MLWASHCRYRFNIAELNFLIKKNDDGFDDTDQLEIGSKYTKKNSFYFYKQFI